MDDTVGTIMTKELFTVSSETTVAETATLMGERRLGSALVTEGSHVVGIFTERDILRAVGHDYNAALRPVGEWMTRDPITVSVDTSVRDALRVMLDGGFRHLPVCDHDDLVGVISMRDLSSSLDG